MADASALLSYAFFSTARRNRINLLLFALEELVPMLDCASLSLLARVHFLAKLLGAHPAGKYPIDVVPRSNDF